MQITIVHGIFLLLPTLDLWGLPSYIEINNFQILSILGNFMHLIILYVIDIHNVLCLEPFLPLYDHFTIWRFLVRNWQYKLKPCHIYIFLIAFLSLTSFDQIVLSHIWARTFDIGSPFPTTWPDIWLKWLWWTTIQLREWMPSLFGQYCGYILFVNQY